MVLFVLGIILVIVAVICVIAAIVLDEGGRVGAAAIAVVAGLLGAVAIGSQTFYSQDSGEASVVVDVSGTIAGQETAPGFHGKAPWQSVKTFNIRNQQVSFVGDGKVDYSGGSAQGPQVTAQDADGVSSNIDVSVRYSLVPGKVTDIYRSFKDEQSFVANYVTQNIRSAARKVPNGFTTLELLTKQGDVQSAMLTAFESSFEGSGVTIDNVSLQEVRPPDAIKQSYAEAQQAQITVTTEKAKLQATQVSAQQQVVQAKAQAQANAELNKGLTSAVLQSRYIDALKDIGSKGNLVVVPAGTNPIIQTKK